MRRYSGFVFGRVPRTQAAQRAVECTLHDLAASLCMGNVSNKVFSLSARLAARIGFRRRLIIHVFAHLCEIPEAIALLYIHRYSQIGVMLVAFSLFVLLLLLLFLFLFFFLVCLFCAIRWERNNKCRTGVQ